MQEGIESPVQTEPEDMTGLRQQIDSLFKAALEVEPAQRAQFLDRRCAGNPALRAEVLALLEAETATWDFTEGPVLEIDDQEVAIAVDHAAARLATASPQSQAVESLGPGDLVDHFRIIRRLGSGGMGVVYKARDTRLGRTVALKLIHPRRVGTRGSKERLLAEARTTARFSHPHIITIHAVGEYQGCPYLALEFVAGHTLRERRMEGPMGVRETMRVGLAIAEALQEAHRHGVLHRDLKPANVLMGRDGRLRVLDFGLATTLARFDHETGDRTPGTGIDSLLSGSPPYMAPEQWRGREFSPATDIWALGLIVIELAEGKAPWSGRDAEEIRQAVCDPSSPVPLPPQWRSDNPELAQLVARCLAKDPRERPDAATVAATLSELLARAGERRGHERSPFKGLQAWDEQDAGWFCGRDDEVEALVERLRIEPLVVLTGPCGAGKSSFSHAGLVPRLRDQGRWLVLRLRPGREPMRSLAARLMWGERTSAPSRPSDAASPPSTPAPAAGALAQGQVDEELALAQELAATPTRLALALADLAERAQAGVLLLVDQLEELFTLVDDEQVQRGFIEALLTSADDPLGAVRTVISIREDFLGRLFETSPSHKAVARIMVLGVPGAAALREIVTRPVAAAGYGWDDPTLVEEMVAAVHGERAALSLLQFAGQALWERRDRERRLLLRAAYDEIGGVGGALAGHADWVLSTLPEESGEIARGLFLRLATPDGARRVLARSTLLEGFAARGAEVLDRFVQERVVVVRKASIAGGAEPEVELVHESLIRAWPRLARWLGESRDEAVFLAEAEMAAELWQRRGKRPEDLWRDDALHDGWRSIQRCQSPVPEGVASFLAAGTERERRERRRRRVAATAGIAALLSVAGVLTFLSIEARHQRVQAELRGAETQLEGARAAYSRGNPLEARARLRAALETADSAAARMLWLQLGQDPLCWEKRLGGWLVSELAFSPNGTTLAATWERSIELIDVASGVGRTLGEHPDLLEWIRFTVDGSRLLTVTSAGSGYSWDLERGTHAAVNLHPAEAGTVCDVSSSGAIACATPGGSISLWDALTGAERLGLEGHQGVVESLTFSPDGTVLASIGSDNQLRLWRVADGSCTASIPHPHQWQPVVGISPNNQLLASADDAHRVRVWSVARGAELRTLAAAGQAEILGLEFSPDGSQLAAFTDDAAIRLWSTSSWGQPLLLRGHLYIITDISFHPFEPLLASSGSDRTVRLWDTRNGALLRSLDGGGTVLEVLVSPDGRYLGASTNDHTVRVWDLHRIDQPPPVAGHASPIRALDFSPDGRQVASGGGDGAVRIWNVGTGTVSAVLRGHETHVTAVAFSPDGRFLASASADRTIRIWDLLEGSRRMEVVSAHADLIGDLSFSADGRLLAYCGSNGATFLYDIESGQRRLLEPQQNGPVEACAFSSDGLRVAAVEPDGNVVEWEVGSGRVLRRVLGDGTYLHGLSYTPDDRQIVVTGYDGSVLRWDLASDRLESLTRLDGRPYWLDVHPDGRRLGLPVSDGTVRVFDVATGSSVVLRGHRSEVNRARFSPDGKLLATVSDDETVRLWEVDRARPFWRATALLGSPPALLSQRGWQRLDGGEGEGPPVGPEADRLLEDEGRLARQSDDGTLLCVVTHAGGMSVWDLAADRRTAGLGPEHGFEDVRALASGCVAWGRDGTVLLVDREGSSTELRNDGRAVAVNGDEILVAGDGQITAHDAAGVVLRRWGGRRGVTALTRIGERLVLGCESGALEVSTSRAGSTAEIVTLRDTPPSPVLQLEPGPHDTLVAGFANGLIGIWSLSTGDLLYAARLHGPITHLVLSDEHLQAASELGAVLSLPLAALQRTRCEILREVWAEVPVVWERGRPLRRPPPAGHACAESGPGSG